MNQTKSIDFVVNYCSLAYSSTAAWVTHSLHRGQFWFSSNQEIIQFSWKTWLWLQGRYIKGSFGSSSRGEIHIEQEVSTIFRLSSGVILLNLLASMFSLGLLALIKFSKYWRILNRFLRLIIGTRWLLFGIRGWSWTFSGFWLFLSSNIFIKKIKFIFYLLRILKNISPFYIFVCGIECLRDLKFI